MDDFKRVRELFDNWRTKEKGVLKTLADWEVWQDYQRMAAASKLGVPRGKGGLVDQAKRIFLQAYATSNWGLPGSDYKGIAAFLTEHGYPTKVNDLKNAKRKSVALVEHAIAHTDEVKKFIYTVRARYPEFDWRKMVVQ